MYDRIKRLYLAGRLTREGVLNAMKKGLITAEQGNKILENTTEEEFTL